MVVEAKKKVEMLEEQYRNEGKPHPDEGEEESSDDGWSPPLPADEDPVREEKLEQVRELTEEQRRAVEDVRRLVRGPAGVVVAVAVRFGAGVAGVIERDVSGGDLHRWGSWVSVVRQCWRGVVTHPICREL